MNCINGVMISVPSSCAVDRGWFFYCLQGNNFHGTCVFSVTYLSSDYTF